MSERKKGAMVVMGCDLYNGTLTGDKAATVGANSGMSANHAGPAVIVGAFMAGQGAKARSIAYCDDGTTPTLKGHPSGLNMAPSSVYPINTMVALRGGKDDMRTCFGVGEPDDPQFTLSAAHGHAVCYAIEGNVVDRVSSKNGKGWCEDVIPTLNTQDRHAVCFQQNQREEVLDMGETAGCLNADSGMHNTNYVCFRKASKPGSDGKGERWEESEITNTLNGFEFHSPVRTPEIICYAPNGNHCGAFLPAEVSATLETKYHYGSGGDAVLVVEKRHE